MNRTKVFALSIATLIVSSISSFAADVTLKWDAPPQELSGYALYAVPVMENYNYEIPLWTGQSTSCTVEIESNTELKFVVRAYLNGSDGTVYESEDSNEIKHAVIKWQNPNLRIE